MIKNIKTNGGFFYKKKCERNKISCKKNVGSDIIADKI